MSTNGKYPKLRERTLILLVNFAIAYVVFVIASKTFLFTGGLESVWLISALALWFLNFLSAPWYLPPRDALPNAIAALVILTTVDLGSVSIVQTEINVLRWIGAAYCVVVAILSLTALVLHDKNERDGNTKLAFRMTGILGKGEILYTFPAVISIIGGYQNQYSLVALLVVTWVFLIVVRPIEQGATAIRQWKIDTENATASPSVGTIDRVDHPNIVRVRISPGGSWSSRRLHIAAMPNGDQSYVFSLFSQVQGTDVIGTGLCVSPVQEKIQLPAGDVCLSHDEAKASKFIEKLSGTKDAELVGFTVEYSTIGVLRFEVASPTSLAEGNVVFARVNGDDVFYQIIDAETSEESFDQNPRGTHIVRASQLGVFSKDKGFLKYPWLPEMNSPLFSTKGLDFEQRDVSDREFKIGIVPSTKISVTANIDDLVEYHAAILGVTGTGKTELALEVVREAIAKGTKAFCVDFTGEYAKRLEDLNPEYPKPTDDQARDLEDKLFAVETGQYGAGEEKRILKIAMDELRGQTGEQVDAFLRSEDHKLAIFEFSEIANTKATLRLTELYLSSIMKWARENRQAQRILLVFEEAHTIIPETAGSGFDYDTQWVVSRIGQIALQGRKYGVGMLVVSQRTALVSKTILSQCNTFLTHSLIDQTSLNFLGSVYSSDHAKLIPNLGQFEFLAFGKAINAGRPIILRKPFDQAKKDASDAMRQTLEGAVPD